MGAVVFETFAPGEISDVETAKSRAEETNRVRDEAYANGFKDGVSVTNDALQSSQSEISSAVLEALSDTSLSQNAAIAKSLADVVALVDAFCEAVAPALSKSGLGAEIGAVLETALRDATAHQITVCHSGADEKTMREMIGAQVEDVRLHVDQTLSQGQVHVAWDNGFSSIDINEAVARAMLKISNFSNMITQQEEEPENDRRNASPG